MAIKSMNVRILSIGYKIAPESAFRTVLHPGSEAIASMGVAGRTSSWRGGGERAESQRYELWLFMRRRHGDWSTSGSTRAARDRRTNSVYRR